MELIQDKDGRIRQLHKNPHLVALADTLEALNLCKAMAYLMVSNKLVTQDEFMATLQMFTKHAPDYLIEEMYRREEHVASILKSAV